MRVFRWFLMTFLAFSIVLTGCGGGGAGSDSQGSSGGDSASGEPTETYKLNMSVTTGNQSTWYKAAELFANEVAEKTDGRIQISIFPNEQLSGGDTGKGVEMLIKGDTDLSYHSSIIYTIIDERLGVVSAPFLFKNFDEVDQVLSGAGGEALKAILREKGVEPLGFGQNGFRQITNSRNPIQKPEDLKGMKVRIPGMTMYIDLFKEFGADPVTMSFSEVYTSLQQGTIDGQENPIDVIHSSKLYEVQQYLTLWNYSYDPLVLGMNKKLFDSMHPSDQQVIMEAAAKANAYQIQLAREEEAKQIQELKDAGMQVYEPTEEELAAFQEIAKTIYDKYESIWGKELLDAFMER